MAEHGEALEALARIVALGSAQQELVAPPPAATDDDNDAKPSSDTASENSGDDEPDPEEAKPAVEATVIKCELPEPDGCDERTPVRRVLSHYLGNF